MKLLDLFKKNNKKKEVKKDTPMERYIERLNKLYARSKV